MKENLSILFLISLFVISCQKGSEESSVDKDSPEALLKFIPKNYMLKDTIAGDLNKDEIKDLILVFNKEGEEQTSDINNNPEKRLVLILLGQKNNTYKKVKQSENAIYCFDCGGMLGDPFQKITVKEGQFSIEHFGGSSWRWARTSTFKYMDDKKDWYLIEDALVNSHASEPDNIEATIKSIKDFGEVRFEEFDIYKD